MKELFRFKPFGLIAYLICLFPYFALAQTTTVTGTVRDVTGEELIGVNVMVKGGTTGTVTDIDGKYSIAASPNGTLVFSYIGYRIMEVPVNGKNKIDITMESDFQELDEVVVIAYGAQKKVTITGAVSNVNTADLLKSPSPSLGNALSGKLPGLATVQFSGLPGSDDPMILVRGVGSLSQSGSTPLILVDGVERSFTQIDPHEVADISILKDASATAVFGVRGANGVILITTKRGEAGKTSISVSTSWGAQTPTRFLSFADSYRYATFYNNAQLSDGVDPGSLKYSEEAIQAFKDGSQPLIYPNTDWIDYIMKNMALQSQHNININGGNETAKYFVSVGMLSQDGIFKTFETDKNANFGYNRYNYRANVDINLSKTSILSVNLGGRLEDRNFVGGGEDNLFRYLMDAPPMAGAGIVDGKRILANTAYVGDYARDGLDTFYGQGYTNESTNVLNFDLMFEQKLDALTKGLSFKIKGSYNSSYTHQKRRSGSLPTYKPILLDDGTIGLEKSGDEWKLGYEENSWFSRDWYAEASLDYQRKFGVHNFTGLLLYNQSKKYFPKGSNTWTPNEEIPTGYVGLVGRITYDYNTRYLLDVNMGYNGSENFAPGKRYGFFPSASAGWIISSEDFMENQSVVTYLKFRYSYGKVGNDKMGDNRFLYLPGAYNINNSYGSGYNFGTNIDRFLPIANESTMGNPDVTWETAVKQNLGIDFKTLNDRLSISVDLFRENRSNILISSGSFIPGYAALAQSPPINYGKVRNQGYEITFSWSDRIGNNFLYTISPYIAFNRNKIIEQAEVRQDEPYMYRTGGRVSQPFGYEFWGFYEGIESEEKYKQEFGIDIFPTQMAELKPGDVIYVDLNNDGVIDSKDVHAIGYPDYPEYTFALNMNFQYKNFDFSMLWNGATNVSRSLGYIYRPQMGEQNKSALLDWVYENSWTPETAGTAILPRMTFDNMKNNTADSRIWLIDASYVRLKNVELGYSFRDIPKIKAINSVRVFFTGYNLLTFSKFKANDPENTGGSYNNFIKYPQMKVFNFGLNVNF